MKRTPEQEAKILTELFGSNAVKLAHEIAALDLTGLSETDPRQVFNLVIPVLEGTSFEDAENAIYFAIHLLVDQEAADHLSGVSDWYAGRIMLDIHKEDRVFQARKVAGHA